MRQVILYPGEDGFFVAECPSLPGCISQGQTRQQTIENIREAIQLYVEVLVERGQPVPEEKFGSWNVARYHPSGRFKRRRISKSSMNILDANILDTPDNYLTID